jgi:hypothetical protein
MRGAVRVYAGSYVLDEHYCNNGAPTGSRENTPDAVVTAFLRNSFACELLSARITPEQCETNRKRPASHLYPCRSCTQERPLKPKGKTGRVPAMQQGERLSAHTQRKAAVRDDIPVEPENSSTVPVHRPTDREPLQLHYPREVMQIYEMVMKRLRRGNGKTRHHSFCKIRRK